MESTAYTAKEMRDTADHIYADYGVARIPISETPLTYKDVRGWEIAAMLRQAADMIESEERRKSSTTTDYSFVDESGFRVSYLYDSVETAKRRAVELGYNAKYFIRREVGEWEEVEG